MTADKPKPRKRRVRMSDEPQAPIPLTYLRQDHPAILSMSKSDAEFIVYLHLLGLCYFLKTDVLPCAYCKPITLAHELRRERRTVERLLVKLQGHHVLNTVAVPGCDCQKPHIRLVGLRSMWPDMQWRCDENGRPIERN